MKKYNKAYTLAEVVVTMFIIAIIVGVSLRIAKVKLDSIVSLNYYSAYSSLKTVVSEMLSDFNAEEDKGYVFSPLAAYAYTYITTQEECTAKGCYSNFLVGDGTTECVCPDKDESDTGDSSSDDSDLVVPLEPLNPDDSSGSEDSTGSGESGTPDTVCTEDSVGGCACGTVFNSETCACESFTCPEGKELSCVENACVPIQRTVPRTGKKFCDLFVAYSNTKTNTTECEGTSVANNTTDFSDVTPDITLRNGMLLYNLSASNVQKINILNGIEQGASYGVVTDPDYIPNVNEYGYTVYIDIDGPNSNSTLWEDVFPFYVTLSGKVIPAFNDGETPAGANSKLHMQASVQKEKVSGGSRNVYWPVKSGTYQDAACVSGYLNGTDYCSGITTDNECLDNAIDCEMKVLKPFKFF